MTCDAVQPEGCAELCRICFEVGILPVQLASVSHCVPHVCCVAANPLTCVFVFVAASGGFDARSACT